MSLKISSKKLTLIAAPPANAAAALTYINTTTGGSIPRSLHVNTIVSIVCVDGPHSFQVVSGAAGRVLITLG